MSELNDKELFESAISDAPVETVEAPAVAESETVTANDGPVRDDKGRFAPQKEIAPEPVAATPVVEQPVAAKDEAHVPSWRLREVNDKAEAAERRAREVADRNAALEREMAAFRQAQQKPPEPIDPWQDLPGHLQQTLTPYDQRLNALQSDTSFKMSRLTAMVEHGKDAVLEMEKYVKDQSAAGNPQLRMLGVQMQNSDDPVSVAMQWYQRDKLLSETGGDLSAYKTKTLDEALKDPAFLAKAIEAAKAQATGIAPGARPNSVVQLPPSINRATSAASPHDEPGGLSDGSLYQFATR